MPTWVTLFFFLKIILILKIIYLFIWLHWVLVEARGIFIVEGGLQSMQARSAFVVHRLSCPLAQGVFVLKPGIKIMSLALEGGFLTIRPPGKSQVEVFDISDWEKKLWSIQSLAAS